MSDVKYVLSEYMKLTPAEQNEFKSTILSRAMLSGNDLKKYVENSRFSKGRVCPLCGSTHVVRNGHRKDGTQKYMCVNCVHSFVSTSNSITSGTKKNLSTWKRYIDCMFQGLSVRDSARICGIHKNTAFIWRYKILDALQEMADNVTLDGIVEADETFLNVSYKGNHQNSKVFLMPRKSHKRGNDSHIKGLSSDKVCIPCAVNRNGLSISKVSNLAKVKTDGLRSIFSGRISSGSTLITDKEKAYRRFASENQLELKQLKSGKDSCKGIYNIQHINNYHSQLKKFLRNFNGVSTKYLNNYLIWHNLVNYSKEDWIEKKNLMLEFVLSIPIRLLCKDLSNRVALPLLA